MQSNKPSSKKTPTNADASKTAGSETNNSKAEVNAKPRTTKSSTVKNSTTIETSSAKHHRKSATPVTPRVPVPDVSPSEAAPEAKATAAAVGAQAGTIDSASKHVASDYVVPAAKPRETASVAAPVTSPTEITQEEIAKLAHSYWVARGYPQGDAIDDWTRAERELKSKR